MTGPVYNRTDFNISWHSVVEGKWQIHCRCLHCNEFYWVDVQRKPENLEDRHQLEVTMAVAYVKHLSTCSLIRASNLAAQQR